jgi:MIP family channel proteins
VSTEEGPTWSEGAGREEAEAREERTRRETGGSGGLAAESETGAGTRCERRATGPVPGADGLLGAAVAEAIGTYLLVLFATGAVVGVAVTAEAGGIAEISAALELFGLAGVALAYGFAVLAAVYAFGHVSGAHVNPAVTLGLASARRFPWSAVPAYLAAQLLGALLASLTVFAVYPDSAADSPITLGATAPGFGAGHALLAEFAITFVLMVVFMATVTDRRATPAAAGLALGLTVAAATAATLPVSGGSLNPARTLAPMIVATDLSDFWVYIVGPVLGALVGAFVYEVVTRHGSPPTAAGGVDERPRAGSAVG